MDNATQPRLFDLRSAASYLGSGVSVWTLRDLIWKGDLPSVRLGRKIFVAAGDLDDLVAKLRHFEGS